MKGTKKVQPFNKATLKGPNTDKISEIKLLLLQKVATIVNPLIYVCFTIIYFVYYSLVDQSKESLT